MATCANCRYQKDGFCHRWPNKLSISSVYSEQGNVINAYMYHWCGEYAFKIKDGLNTELEGLPIRIRRALCELNIKTKDDLQKADLSGLANMRQIGQKSIDILNEFIAERGEL